MSYSLKPRKLRYFLLFILCVGFGFELVKFEHSPLSFLGTPVLRPLEGLQTLLGVRFAVANWV